MDETSLNVDYSGSLRAQARVRALLSVPVIVAGMVMLYLHADIPAAAFYAVTIQVIYFVSAAIVAYRAPDRWHKPASFATAVLDPLILSAWLPIVGGFGPVLCAFYLFTILGFGFRTSIRHMTVCQTVSLAAMIVVMLATPFWTENPAVAIGVIVTTAVVPLYARHLLHQLHLARARAESESQFKSDLLARVSHELRTPLTGIVSAADLIAAETADPESARRAATIITLSGELLTEINNLLDESKQTADGIALRPAPIDPRELATVLHAAFDAVAQQKGVEFRVVLDPRLPDRVLADQHYLGRVLVNLAGNAVKFTSKGSVRVTIERGNMVADQPAIRFVVEDTGPGIAHEYQEAVFKPFFQVRGGAIRQQGGTGLGLSISKAVVTAMGGSIQLQSEPGKGSRFSFEVVLPVCDSAGEVPDIENADEPAAPACPIRILVVDDNRTNSELVKEMLSADGHSVATAIDGMTALEKLASGDKFDLLFLDYNLPDMSGADVLKTYRFGTVSPAPAFFLTADATRVTRDKLADSGALGVLSKPLRRKELRKAVAKIADANGPRDNEAPGPRRAKPVLVALTTPVLDRQVVDELGAISADQDFAARLLHTALGDVDRNVRAIQASLAGGAWAEARDGAHALKGVAISVGALGMGAVASRILNAKDKDLEELADVHAAALGKQRQLLQEEIDRLAPVQNGRASAAD
jgi:two-component system sensor histidine kinase RpfC